MDEDAPGTGAPAEEYLEFAGGRVHVLRGGSGAPLLFLHAAGGAGQWLEFHELLARRFEVIAPDHPGFGGSDELADVADMDDLAYHYLDLMARLGLDRPHVVGASLGGWLAAELAVLAPREIGSLTLLSPVGLRLPDHPVLDLFMLRPQERVAALFRDPARARALLPADPDIDTVLADYRDMTALARFAWTPFMSNPKLERRLHRIAAPTRVIWPEEDRLVPIEHGRRYAELIPGAELAVVKECGHAMYFERPAEFADLVADFVAGVERRAER
jgi:pimeloyl-ACP methyl ester carboxylesterase